MSRSSGKSRNAPGVDVLRAAWLTLVVLAAWAVGPDAAAAASGGAPADTAGEPAQAAPSRDAESGGPARTPAAVPAPALWVDFERSAGSLTSPEAVEAFVDSAADAGFKRLIIDLKKRDGSVAFASRRAPQIKLSFDYFGAFRKAADKRGLESIALLPVFQEGDTRTGVGPAYDHPDWQSITWTRQDGPVPQARMTSAGPVLMVNPCLRDVQEYEASVVSDLLSSVKPPALLLDEIRFLAPEADLGDSTRLAFQRWAGIASIAHWPGDVLDDNGAYRGLWLTFRTGVIHEFVARIRALMRQVAPDTRLYLSAPGYYEPCLNYGTNWAHSAYAPKLWYATSDLRKTSLSDLADQLFLIVRDANPMAVREITRGAHVGTQNRLPVSLVLLASQHVGRPARFRECLQIVRDQKLGVAVGDANLLGAQGFWDIAKDELTAPVAPWITR